MSRYFVLVAIEDEEDAFEPVEVTRCSDCKALVLKDDFDSHCYSHRSSDQSFDPRFLDPNYR
jgi:hypothetical protein